MLHFSLLNLARKIVPGHELWRSAAVLSAVFICGTSPASDSLRVEHPVEIAFSIGEMTELAQDMGLSTEEFARSLTVMLNNAGLEARQSEAERDTEILFLDVIVDGESYYTSVGFWRMASYPLPNGEINSEFVTVWQDYSVGTHFDDATTVKASVNRIVERFISKYNDANQSGFPLRVASAP